MKIEEIDTAEADFPRCGNCCEWSVFAQPILPMYLVDGVILCESCFLEALADPEIKS